MLRYLFDEADRAGPMPAFKLAEPHGRTVALGDFRGLSNLVLVFLAPGDAGGCRDCAEVLTEFAVQREAYRSHDAEVLIIAPARPADINALSGNGDQAFPRLLADESGSVRARYASELPVAPGDNALVFVLDRFGAPYAAFATREPAGPEVHKEALGWLHYIELRCPE